MNEIINHFCILWLTNQMSLNVELSQYLLIIDIKPTKPINQVGLMIFLIL